jgi:hypothetical protein
MVALLLQMSTLLTTTIILRCLKLYLQFMIDFQIGKTRERAGEDLEFNYSCLYVLVKAEAIVEDIDEYLYYREYDADKEVYRILSASCAKSKLTIGCVLDAAT